MEEAARARLREAGRVRVCPQLWRKLVPEDPRDTYRTALLRGGGVSVRKIGPLDACGASPNLRGEHHHKRTHS